MVNKATKPVPDEDYSDLPPRLREQVAKSPEWMDAQQSAKAVEETCFKISPRTIPTWNLPSRIINGRRMHRTVDVLREAQRRIDQAPELMRGKQLGAVLSIGRGRRRERGGECQRAPPPT
jgi:hypothetical protein